MSFLGSHGPAPKQAVERDKAHLAAVAQLPCACWDTGLCFGDVTAHHVGHDGGTALKANDYQTIPVCARHHDEIHRHSGRFKGWNAGTMDAWCDEQVRRTLATVAERAAGREVTW